jgi:hypothetical protein
MLDRHDAYFLDVAAVIRSSVPTATVTGHALFRSTERLAGTAAPKSRDEGPQHDLLRALVDSAE